MLLFLQPRFSLFFARMSGNTTPSGLTHHEAEARLAQYGRNVVAGNKNFSATEHLVRQFTNPLVMILIFAALISAATGERVSAGIIILIVIFSAAIDFTNTYKSEKAAEALKRRVMITATVMRDGGEEELPIAEIVPGDIVVLKPGDIVPADGKVLQSKDFFINESSLTGESFPVEKIVGAETYMGSSAISGNGLIEVTLTGARTKFGAIAHSLSERAGTTEFDRNIKDFSVLVMKVTFALVIVVFFINALFKHDVLESFLFATALAVGLTPELLPMIIALNLSKGSLTMAKHGVIVKRLSAIQNFGSMDVFCTDKTGTLTEDRIELVKYLDGEGRPSDTVLLHAYLSSLFHTGIANPFDKAVKEFRTIDIDSYVKIDEIPFDFTRKRDSIVVENADGRKLISKGAPEEIFTVCKSYENADMAYAGKNAAAALAQYRALSADGFRVLAVATRAVDADKNTYERSEEHDMTFVGFVAFYDPPKKTVGETLKKIRDYGIEVKIITGDNELVTKKITDTIGLPVKGVLLGSEMAELGDDALRIRAEQTTIFARVNPIEKLRIIRTLRRNGHVVGYLGDGINDAPSLKAADVGISVNNAVDVAKESADLILLHKNLTELTHGVIEGRRTFANTLKYLMMSLSSNFGNMFSVAGASVFLPFLPMLPTQILLNNLIYDVSQFTIPMDNVDDEELRAPRRMSIDFIKKFMWVFGPLSSVFDFVTFGLLFFVFKFGDGPFQTGWFIESLATQTFVIYVIRTRKLPFIQSRPSAPLFYSILAAVVIGWTVAQSALGKLFNFVPLPPSALAAVTLIVVCYLITVEIVKRWFFRHASMPIQTLQIPNGSIART
jgi:Mg2+-importing ATPase